MQIEIEIKDILYPTLQELSSENGLSSQEYAANIVQSFLESQYRASVINHINLTKLEDLKEFKEKNIKEIELKDNKNKKKLNG